MSTAIPSISCLGVIGRNNNPLHIAIFPSYDPISSSFAPIRSPLQFSLLLSSTIDVFDLRAKHNTVSGDFGLLHAIDDRLAAYGFETNTGVRMVCVVDMRGRRVDGSGSGGGGGGGGGGGNITTGSGGGGGGGGSGGLTAAAARASSASSSSSAAAAGVGGLRDAEMKPVFRAMQNAYVRLLQNPFYDPDEHSPLGGRGGKRITNRRFAEDMKRIGEAWTPGVTSF